MKHIQQLFALPRGRCEAGEHEVLGVEDAVDAAHAPLRLDVCPETAGSVSHRFSAAGRKAQGSHASERVSERAMRIGAH